MKIQPHTRFQTAVRKRQSEKEVMSQTLSDPVELYDFKTNATMVGVSALGGGLAGAIPGLGALTFAAPSHGPSVGSLTKAVALGGFVTNLVGTGLVLSGRSAWAMAVPGALGAVTWGSWAYSSRNDC